jgi:hypothetical protein
MENYNLGIPVGITENNFISDPATALENHQN